MTGRLPTNLDNLLHLRSTETVRVEFKASWDKHIREATVRTVCAFANDLLNLNGGYVILGVESDEQGRARLPPKGIDDQNIDRIQLELSGACKSISPEYLPHMFVEQFEGNTILVVWAAAGDNRPYEAPGRRGGRAYWVRSGSETIEAKGDLRRQLIEQAAKIPFDDRRSLAATVDDISASLIRQFLADIRSYLASNEGKIDEVEVYRRLRLVVKVNDHEIPRNVALLFFNDGPERFFPGAYVEVVQFGEGGDLIQEKSFLGPLHEQIRTCLRYLDGLGGALLQKVRGQAEVERTVPYPYEAMEEALVNAVYHRGYNGPPEPVKVYLYPDRMEITSYPGPVPGILKEHLEAGGRIPPVAARNRRIGEFLKELRLAEGRGTGIPKIRRRMQENGSPEAGFQFDDERTYFTVVLPVHPRYKTLHALREAARLWAVGQRDDAISHLQRAFVAQPSSGVLTGQIIEYAFAVDDEERARDVLEVFGREKVKSEASKPYLTMARLLMDRQRVKEAAQFLEQVPAVRTAAETLEMAILRKRAKNYQEAHKLFTQAYSVNPDDPKIIHEFAQTKLQLAVGLHKKGKRADNHLKKRLEKEAVELLRRAIQLADSPTRRAWCWYDLARALDWLREPRSEVEKAFLQARTLLPNESRFEETYERWRNKGSNRKR